MSAAKKPRRMWLVLRLLPWSALEHYGQRLPNHYPPGEPQGFMPVFKTKAEARKKFPEVGAHEIVAVAAGGGT